MLSKIFHNAKTLESEDGLYGPLLWPFWDDNTAVQFSISKPFLSIEFVFWFWENQKGKLEILGEACEAAAFAQYWGETAIPSCCCFWNSQKWKTIKGFFLQFIFKTKPIAQQSNIFILSGSSFWFQPFCSQWTKMHLYRFNFKYFKYMQVKAQDLWKPFYDHPTIIDFP